MRKKDLEKRIFVKKATPLKDRAVVKQMFRRDENFQAPQEEHPNDHFESFFDYEEDLSELKPASDQFEDSFVMEEKESSFLVMEESQEEKIVLEEKTSNSSGIVLEVESEVSLSYCEYSVDGKVCKNEKSKLSIYCEQHKQELIDNIKKQNGFE